MREIKFRIWDNYCKYFINFDFSHPYFNDEADQVTFDCDKVMGDHGGLERFTFQQFIGAKDKNDKEIYEGDIIRHDRFRDGKVLINYPVIWKDGAFMLGDSQWLVSMALTEDVEVIGNIYENSELIKQV